MGGSMGMYVGNAIVAAAVRPLLLADLATMLAAWALWRALHRGGRAPRG